MNYQSDMSALLKIIGWHFVPQEEVLAVLRYIKDANKNALLFIAVESFIYGVIQGKRAERKRRHKA